MSNDCNFLVFEKRDDALAYLRRPFAGNDTPLPLDDLVLASTIPLFWLAPFSSTDEVVLHLTAEEAGADEGFSQLVYCTPTREGSAVALARKAAVLSMRPNDIAPPYGDLFDAWVARLATHEGFALLDPFEVLDLANLAYRTDCTSDLRRMIPILTDSTGQILADSISAFDKLIVPPASMFAPGQGTNAREIAELWRANLVGVDFKAKWPPPPSAEEIRLANLFTVAD